MFISIVDRGAEEFLRGWHEEAEALREVNGLTVTVGNDVEVAGVNYAHFLQDRIGFTVIDEDILMRHVSRAIRNRLSVNKPLDTREMRQILFNAGMNAIREMLAFSGGARPPVSPGGPPRPAHNVGWADITTALARHYFFKFDDGRKLRLLYSGSPNR